MIRFLGSASFAILLLALTALFVVVGTFVEGITGSHEAAASVSYNSPFFFVLLAGFFINILLSALRRFPFQKKHIPFLMTHLGLLMILAGVFVKVQYGLQGTMRIIEGAATDEVVLPKTFALHVQHKTGTVFLHTSPVHVIPHAEPYWDSWIKKDKVDIQGLAPIDSGREDQAVRFRIYDPPFLVIARHAGSPSFLEKLYIESTEIALYDRLAMRRIWKGPLAKAPVVLDWEKKEIRYKEATLPLSGKRALIARRYAIDLTTEPTIAFVEQDLKGIAAVFGPSGLIVEKTYDKKAPDPLYVYDKGYGGYGTEWSIPYDLLMQTRQQREEALLDTLTNQLRELNDFAHPLQPFREASEDFAADFSELLTLWYLQGDGILSQYAPFSATLLRTLNRMPLGNLSPQEKGSALSLYLKNVKIEPHAVLDELKPADPDGTLTLETPLVQKQRALEPPAKLEDLRPAATFLFGEEPVTLVYDPSGCGPPTPTKDGHHLLRYQPRACKISTPVRLHSVEKTVYPGTDHPAAYEAVVSVKQEKEWMQATLSMNRVLQTADNTRFYLSGISPQENLRVKTAHLVVNYDPAKALLTYPGAILTVLGACILLFRLRKSCR